MKASHGWMYAAIVGVAFITLAIGCGTKDGGGARDSGDRQASESGTHPVVYTVNYPLQYFAQRIGRGEVDVVFPDIEGDPAYWEPDAEEVGEYQKADLILLNGAGYAGWVSKASLPAARTVDTGRELEDRLIVRHDVVTHTHGPGGPHTHRLTAFTTWIDPTMAIVQARAIEEAFARAWPERASTFQHGLSELEAELDALDARLDSVTSQINEPLVMSHPVFPYFERRFHLNARSVHFEPNLVPDDEQISGLRALLNEHPAKWMIWEGNPLPEAAKLIDGLGLKSVVFDPCGNKPDAGDFMDVMRRNVSELEKIVNSHTT